MFKGLVQKARKAKNKLLKRDGDDRAESGTQGYESFSYGGVDPYMWEPQELGKKISSLTEQTAVGHLACSGWLRWWRRQSKSKRPQLLEDRIGVEVKEELCVFCGSALPHAQCTWSHRTLAAPTRACRAEQLVGRMLVWAGFTDGPAALFLVRGVLCAAYISEMHGYSTMCLLSQNGHFG